MASPVVVVLTALHASPAAAVRHVWTEPKEQRLRPLQQPEGPALPCSWIVGVSGRTVARWGGALAAATELLDACGVILAGACRAISAVRAWPLLLGCAGATTVASQRRGLCCRAQCL
ncbi:hypothetical protein TcBrA4_0080680 [Trypanosoma cruzi]|nr:hypothetical protein TcBrA4_0080680 [Trypanosoma cruzi]